MGLTLVICPLHVAVNVCRQRFRPVICISPNGGCLYEGYIFRTRASKWSCAILLPQGCLLLICNQRSTKGFLELLCTWRVKVLHSLRVLCDACRMLVAAGTFVMGDSEAKSIAAQLGILGDAIKLSLTGRGAEALSDLQAVMK